MQALNWAQSHSLNVIVDIHGAPGSQNGYDNSGQRTQPPMWAANQTNVQKTIDCVTFLAKTVGDKINVFEVMNEPAGFLGDDFTNVLRQYYINAYGAIRTESGNSTGVMFSDGFRGLDVSTRSVISPLTQPFSQYWGSSFNAPQYQGTSMDIVGCSSLLVSPTITECCSHSICTRSSATSSSLAPSTNTSATRAT